MLRNTLRMFSEYVRVKGGTFRVYMEVFFDASGGVEAAVGEIVRVGTV